MSTLMVLYLTRLEKKRINSAPIGKHHRHTSAFPTGCTCSVLRLGSVSAVHSFSTYREGVLPNWKKSEMFSIIHNNKSI